MIIIPALDIREGRCVRLVQGDPARERVYADDPLAMAQRFADRGASWLHIVDLDGAFAGRPVHLGLVASIAARLGLPVQVGGGYRTLEDVAAGLQAGAARVILGTAAAALAAPAARRFGERVAVAVDVRAGRLAIDGWRALGRPHPAAWAKRLAAGGIRRFIYTDVTRDGTLRGPDVEGVRAFIAAVGVPVIAGGGVATAGDVAALARAGAEGVVVGRALYEGHLDLHSGMEG